MIIAQNLASGLDQMTGAGSIVVNIGGKGPSFSPFINFLAVMLGASLAWFTSYQMEKLKQKKQDLATAYSLVFKIQHFVNEIIQVQRLISEAIIEAEKAGATGPLWTKIVEIAGIREERISISPEEMSLLARAKDVSLLMDIRDLEAGHNILMQSISKLFKMRAEFGKLVAGKTLNGRVFEFELDIKANPEGAALLTSLTDLSKGLESMIPRILAHAVATANAIGPALKNHYKFKDFISIAIEVPEGSPNS